MLGQRRLIGAALSLEKDTPDKRPIQAANAGKIEAILSRWPTSSLRMPRRVTAWIEKTLVLSRWPWFARLDRFCEAWPPHVVGTV
jgi:hypothetical protein